MEAPLGTPESGGDVAANERAARKFDQREKDDPFAQAEEAKPNYSDTRGGSMLLDKFDLTRIDILHEMNQQRAEQLR